MPLRRLQCLSAGKVAKSVASITEGKRLFFVMGKLLVAILIRTKVFYTMGLKISFVF